MTLDKIKDKILETIEGVGDMLIEKNKRYGNSALDPIRIFSQADPAEQLKVRIDDKLSRIVRGQGAEGEDVIDDLIGYLVLLKIARKTQGRISFRVSETSNIEGIVDVVLTDKFGPVKAPPVKAIQNCANCGSRPNISSQLYDGGIEFMVDCPSCIQIGPEHGTELEAIEGWNDEMDEASGPSVLKSESDPEESEPKDDPPVKCICGERPVLARAGSWQWVECSRCPRGGSRKKTSEEAIRAWNEKTQKGAGK